ncbi:MAG: flagella accessory protein C [Candidatus Thermoplasmatota archaeon]
MKDFDFQIKKNQEDIGKLTEKIDSLTKDLDDLVSLYEIVSEQMNPFVGLSKVTKKRLDALENFTKEIETLNTRIGEIESVLEKNKMILDGKIPQPQVKPAVQNKPELKPTEAVSSSSDKQSIPVQGETDEKKLSQEIPNSSVVEPQINSSSDSDVWSNFTDEDLDRILAESLSSLMIDQNIDSLINDFLLNLK